MILFESVGFTVGQRVVNSANSCRDGLCSTTLDSFDSERNESYRVGITFNGIRESNITLSSAIGGSLREGKQNNFTVAIYSL